MRDALGRLSVAGARSARSVRAFETQALLLRRVDYAEADWVVTLLTEDAGRVSALARAARKSRKRFGGSLEPMHTLKVRLEERPHAELLTLREATLASTRRHLVTSLDRLDAAGRALGWVRRAAVRGQDEPEVWRSTIALLDRLDDRGDSRSAKVHLAEFGLHLLRATGWGIELERCVRCGRDCEPGRAAMIDAARGGLVCRACGGASRTLSGDERARYAEASTGAAGVLEEPDATTALRLVEDALRAHAGLEE